MERTPWHPAFAFTVEQCGPTGTVVKPEVALGTHVQRIDLLLFRRKLGDGHDARILKGLWSFLPRRVIVEFKSVSRAPRRGDFIRLLGYTVQYDALKLARIPHKDELAMVLVTPAWTPTLEREIRRMKWKRESLGDGYYRIHGPPYASYVALIDEVALAEKDPILGAFAHESVRKHLGSIPEDIGRSLVAYLEELDVDLSKNEDTRELTRRVLEGLPPDLRVLGLSPELRMIGLSAEERMEGLRPEERMEGLRPEERMEGLRPEERMKGLGLEDRLLALPDEVLRNLSPEYIDSLPPDTQAEIRRRLDT